VPFLQSSGAISINDLNTFFTGSGTAMSNFYRGGGRVPSTKTTTTITREPSTGDFFSQLPRFGPPPLETLWSDQTQDAFRGDTAQVFIRWEANYTGAGTTATVISGVYIFGVPTGSTSHTVGNITYFRGTFQFSVTSPNTNTYAIFREITTTATVNINAGVPTSGQISLNQFYGAEVP
jgi:hypothetical protein